MTAVVTDINEYRTEKLWRKWTDDRLTKRYRILRLISEGHAELTEGPLAAMSFPGGFKPGSNPEHNLFMVTTELARRGVDVSSA